MGETSIEWATKVWNPVRGCSLVSEGCRNCYAMRQAHRFSGPGRPYEGLTVATPTGPKWRGKARLVPEVLGQPLRWRKPARIFVNSMSDLFHESLTNEQIAQVFHVMYGEASTEPSPPHIYMILTKRAKRMRAWFEWLKAYAGDTPLTQAAHFIEEPWLTALSINLRLQGPHPRVWLGVSVEDQPTADKRIPLLLQTPAAVRWVSAEPLLGPVHLVRTLWNHVPEAVAMSFAAKVDNKTVGLSPLFGIDWVVVGGESGPGARPFNIAWARSAVEQCKAAGVPVFVKQLGAHPFECRGNGACLTDEHGCRQLNGNCAIWLKDKKGGDPSKWPEDLRVREMPEVA